MGVDISFDFDIGPGSRGRIDISDGRSITMGREQITEFFQRIVDHRTEDFDTVIRAYLLERLNEIPDDPKSPGDA
jgi:hypothetical protein